MGLVASQARLLFLTARESDLEFAMQKISQRRMNLSSQMQNIYTQQMNGSSSSQSSGNTLLNIAGYAIGGLVLGEKAGNLLNSIFGGGSSSSSSSSQERQEAQLAQLQEMDKMMEMQMKTLETQQKAVSTEVESVQKIIDNNIKRSFKYMG